MCVRLKSVSKIFRVSVTWKLREQRPGDRGGQLCETTCPEPATPGTREVLNKVLHYVGAPRHAGRTFVPVACGNSNCLLVIHVSPHRTFGWRRPSSSQLSMDIIKHKPIKDSSFRESSPIFLSSGRIVSVTKPIEKHISLFFVIKYKWHVFHWIPCYSTNVTQHTPPVQRASCYASVVQICCPTQACTVTSVHMMIHRYRPPINSVTHSESYQCTSRR